MSEEKPEEETREEHALGAIDSIAISLDRIARVMEARYIRERRLDADIDTLEEVILDAAHDSIREPEDEPISKPPSGAA